MCLLLGAFFARNSPWTVWFLDELWRQDQLVGKYSSKGIPHPFEYEQRAFHFLLQTEVWKRRGLPEYDGDVKRINKHFFFFPQCAFNSYSLHPFDLRGQREQRHYIQGDFLIHFAGEKGQRKVNLMKHYLQSSKEQIEAVDRFDVRKRSESPTTGQTSFRR